MPGEGIGRTKASPGGEPGPLDLTVTGGAVGSAVPPETNPGSACAWQF